ncbi:MAG: type II toxin-antitoxin system HicA family toxin [Thermoguttaceae bacterium]
MKIPRDLPGVELAQALRFLGYELTRQTGSHIRLTRSDHGTEQHITLPAHKSLKIGTLNNILRDISLQVGLTKEELLKKLFS